MTSKPPFVVARSARFLPGAKKSKIVSKEKNCSKYAGIRRQRMRDGTVCLHKQTSKSAKPKRHPAVSQKNTST